MKLFRQSGAGAGVSASVLREHHDQLLAGEDAPASSDTLWDACRSKVMDARLEPGLTVDRIEVNARDVIIRRPQPHDAIDIGYKERRPLGAFANRA